MLSQHLVNHDASQDMTAAQRFFSLPELVGLLCTCCSTERVDLITLASVSRYLRAIALPHWAKHLDVALSTADKKLNFFVENPSLLPKIRYLRIRNDVVERKRRTHHGVQSSSSIADLKATPHWNELKLLLALIAAQSSSLDRPPAIDITVKITHISALEAAFRPFPRLQHCIVALRILSEYDDDIFAGMRMQEIEQMWHQSCTLLARFIQNIYAQGQGCSAYVQSHGADNRSHSGSASGLRLFHFQVKDRSCPPVPLTFWTALSAATASSLRDLTLFLDKSGSPEEIWPLLAHRQLSKFVFQNRASHLGDSFEDSLDHNQSTLQHLRIDIHTDSAAQDLTFRQNFPQLQYFCCQGRYDNHIQHPNNFVQRHPTLKGIINCYRSSNFPHVACSDLRVLGTSREVFEEHALQGGRLSHVRTLLKPEDLYTNSWLTRSPDAARAITCLELLTYLDRRDFVYKHARHHFRFAFLSDLLPNLTEITIRVHGNHDSPPTPKHVLAQVFINLCSAKSLRVLH
ncbi:unnamed protein product, partial [Tilletia controversa]